MLTAQLYRVVNMKALYLEKFIRVSAKMAELAQMSHSEEGELSDEDREIAIRELGLLAEQCLAVELGLSVLLIERMRKELGFSVTHAHISSRFAELIARMGDEAQLTACLIIPRDRAQYYEDKPLFGLEVNDRFPSAILDISEAGKCLACGRGTATVFHLMRVMEVGLKTVAGALAIPYAPSWESYLKQINDRIAVKHKSKGIRWKRDEPFFRDVAAHLQTIKLAWRNPTMHIVNHYDRDAAMDVFNAVKTFMRHLATRFHEPKPKMRGRLKP
jgi:hypothetical protein